MTAVRPTTQADASFRKTHEPAPLPKVEGRQARTLPSTRLKEKERAFSAPPLPKTQNEALKKQSLSLVPNGSQSTVKRKEEIITELQVSLDFCCY